MYFPPSAARTKSSADPGTFFSATILLSVPSAKSKLADLEPTVVHAVNSTNALAPQVSLDPAESEDKPRKVSVCKFFQLAADSTLQKPKWIPINASKDVLSQGLSHGQLIGVSFPDETGQCSKACIESKDVL